ncbi:universal stress protein [Deinococcus maricopensis]|uniref:Osmosensitive K channel His kinase sensor n=1 Tax=Deinococcus maricopensis (strain DSM 21211 / LMG 22137 / NRRL B-23946 / LB-34) TaxID=709986 RepID=E8U858_DEIML|nr:universal stress protein [Deinococcus maricopensis]ADV67247.1 Osmosensitive K channel His kinase sensor [Deinococcus maricopensis DSM 21211]
MSDPTPERQPERLTRPDAERARGHHKIFVGAAAGVGKTYRALTELREHREAGQDAIIGVLETHGRQDTARAADGLPIQPRREVKYKGVQLSEMDLAGLLERRPDMVLVDELAHSNAPGSKNEKRYEDVEELLQAGINVISTVNIQHLESLNDLVARLTGVRVRERVPDHVVQDADEVILVDVTPQVLQDRLRAGKIYAADKVEQALKNFFTDENLGALRELALRQVAEAVQAETEETTEHSSGVKERILVALGAEPESGRLLRRGGRMAKRLGGDLIALYVSTGRLSRDQSKTLDGLRAITESLGGTFVTAPARGGVGHTLVQYVREHGVTQVILGESSRTRFQEFLRGSIIHQVLRDTRNVDVYVISRDK